MKNLLLRGICLRCGKKLKIPFPYNIDLHKNDVMVICSGCKSHSKISFIPLGWAGLGKIQGIFRPPFRPEVPTLEE